MAWLNADVSLHEVQHAMAEPSTRWIHCNTCLGEKKHAVVAEHKQRDSETIDGYDISWSTTHILFQCGGCESVSLCKRTWDSESNEVSEEFYPPEVSRQKPRWVEHLPDQYKSLINEIYTALHADSRALAIMGARTLVDMFMTKHVGDIGGFDAKLAKLVEKGYLSTRNKDILSAAIEAGNAAAHRGYKPEKGDLERVIDVVENMLQFDVLDASAKALRSSTPPRKPT
jgi:hypothetical protein